MGGIPYCKQDWILSSHPSLCYNISGRMDLYGHVTMRQEAHYASYSNKLTIYSSNTKETIDKRKRKNTTAKIKKKSRSKTKNTRGTR